MRKLNTSIQTLLVPTDFTEKSRNALRLAVEVALRHDARIFVIHNVSAHFIIDHTGRQMIGSERVNENIEKASRDLNLIRKELLAQNPGLRLETEIKTGDICDSLNDLVHQLEADLVIMGTSGIQKLKQTLLGSNSYSVLNRAHCSVLLVPENLHQYEFKNILFPVRVVEHLQTKLDFALAIAKRNESLISLFGVGSPETMPEIRAEFLELKDQLRKNGEHFRSKLVLTTDNAETICQTSEEQRSDLVILNFEDEMKWKSLFSENFFKKIINDTDTALLFIKPKNKDTESVEINSYDITLPIPG